MQLSSLVGVFVEKIDPATPLGEAAQTMVSRKVGSLLVTHADRLTGIFTEHDLTRAAAQGVDLNSATVGEWMSEHPRLAAPDWTLDEAADVMVEEGIRHLPLVDADGTPAGVVSIKDLMWAMRGPKVEG